MPHLSLPILPPALPAFLAHRVVFDASSGCQLWNRGKSSQGKYPVLFRDGTCKYAHRLAYESAFGPLPKGYECHHLCANRTCCNVLHLQAVTRTQHNAIHRSLRACKRLKSEVAAA